MNVFVILFMLFSRVAFGQMTTTTRTTDGHTPLEIAPGSPAGAYPLSDFDSISLFNQSLGFRLPLMRVGGRGEAGYPITLPIERKWRVTHTVYDPSAGCGTCGSSPPEHHYRPESNWYTPLKPGFSPGVMVVRMAGIDLTKVGGACGSIYLKALARLTFVGPDGTEYELRDARYNGEPKPPGCDEGANRGKVFVTSDGSSATFVSDSDIKDFPRPGPDGAVIAVSGTLYLRDGTRYHISDNVVDVIRDRNGNEARFYLSAERPGHPGVQYQKAVDSLGREVYINPETSEITYRGFGGAQRTLRVLYAPLHDRLRPANGEHGAEPLQTFGQLFPSLPVNGEDDAVALSQPFDDAVVSEVVLPDGRRYGFRYNSYGELARVELPTGGAFEYDYQADPGVINVLDDYEILRRVVQKRTYNEGGHLESVTTFSGCGALPTGSANSCVQADQLDPDPNASSCAQPLAGTNYRLISRTRHYFNGVPGPGLFTLPTHYTEWDDGKEFRTEVYTCDGTTLLRRVEQEWRQKGQVGWWVNYDATRGPEPSNDPRMVETLTTLADSGQVSKSTSISPLDSSRQTVGFDQYNNPTDLWEFDYGAGAPGALLRHTKTTYLTTNPVNGLDYTGLNPATGGVYLRGLPGQKSVYEVIGEDFSEVERARTKYEYDNYTPDTGNRHSPLTPRGDIFGLCLVRDYANDSCQTPSSAAYLTRGNLTATTNYLLANNGAVTGSVATYAEYDVAGNAVKSIDALGRETSADFGDSFGAPDGDARANVSPAELGSLKAYALPSSVTNALGQTSYTQFDYYLGRPVDGEDINGTHTVLRYDDPLDRLTQGVRAFGSAAQSQTAVAYDGVAHTITVTSDQNTYADNALKGETVYDGLGRTIQTRQYETATQYILTEQKYDATGKPSESSNPYRPALGESAAWTQSAYDSLGRVTSITTPDGARVYTLYHGARTLVTDQDKKQTVSKTDALGRLTDVWEVTAGDPATEDVSFPVPQGLPVPSVSAGYRTRYTYDGSGRLLKVAQGAQLRYFAYDSLGRLVRVRNPEQDAPQSLALPSNMLTALSDYNNAWSLKYEYDEAGNLKKRTDARGAVTDYAYDALNRIQSRVYSGLTGGAAPPVSYTYDDPAVPFSKGRLTSVDNGVSVYSFTAYDRLGRVRGSAQTTDGVTYSMPDYQYNLAGSLVSEQYPSGRVVKTVYDDAGRVAGVKNQATEFYYVGASPADAANRIQYAAHGAFSALRFGNGLWEHASFNTRQQLTQVGLGASSTDSGLLRLDYAYGTTDNNGNLRTQTITVPGMASPLVQTYGYDALNRLLSAAETSGTTPNWKQVYAYDRYGNRTLTTETDYPAQLDATNNPSVSQATNRISSPQYLYDASGNLLQDTSHSYAYDGENRMKAADGGWNGTTGASFFCDGDGRRVKKASASEMTVFVYDAAGSLVAEYSNSVEHNGIQYMTQDSLGSTRIVTGQNQEVRGRYDYLPFGESAGVGFGDRAVDQGYSQWKGLRQGFTGYEKDVETDLSFAKARHYSPRSGRFVSADRLLASAKPVDPQTWNRYAYVLNRPTIATDPDGLSTILVIVNPRSRGGDGSASAIVQDRRGGIVPVGRNGPNHIPGLAKGNSSDRTRSNADTPFGAYRISRDSRSDTNADGQHTGTQGGSADSRPRGVAFGTGIIYMEPVGGEVVENNRSVIYFHGGGSRLGEQAFDPDQPLVSTHGCVRLHNEDVNSLIETVNDLDENCDDPVTGIYIGDAPYLNDLAGQKDENGQYLYPDLRVALGLDPPPPPLPQQQQQQAPTQTQPR